MNSFVMKLPLVLGMMLTATPASAQNALPQVKYGKFLICNSASQIAEYLTLTEAEGKAGLEAQEVIGIDTDGHKACGIGYWAYIFVRQHSKFQAGKGFFAINEIRVIGFVQNGTSTPSKPVTQYGFGTIKQLPKKAGWEI